MLGKLCVIYLSSNLAISSPIIFILMLLFEVNHWFRTPAWIRLSKPAIVRQKISTSWKDRSDMLDGAWRGNPTRSKPGSERSTSNAAINFANTWYKWLFFQPLRDRFRLHRVGSIYRPQNGEKLSGMKLWRDSNKPYMLESRNRWFIRRKASLF